MKRNLSQVIDKIVITGDIFRPTELEFRPSQTSNIKWFGHLVRRSLHKATHLPVEIITWGDGFDTNSFYEAAGLSLDIGGWAKLYDVDLLPLEAVTIVAEAFHRSMVVGFELPLFLKNILSSLNVCWMDFSIHPIRFAPDLLFAVQTNSGHLLDYLNSTSVSLDQFDLWADILMATAAKMPTIELYGATALLVGQTAADRALIKDGKFLNFSDFEMELKSRAECHKQILVKEHPYASDDFGISDLRIPLHKLRKIDSNIYRIMSNDSIKEIISLSSSVLVEAKFFFKKVSGFAPLPFNIEFPLGQGTFENHFSINGNIASEAFWSNALGGLGFGGVRGAQARPLPPNTLRTSLLNFWGYNEMTSDLLVKAYRNAG